MNMKQIEDLIRDTNARTEADIRAAVEAIEPETRLSTTEKHLANAKRRIVELERDLAVARIERDAARDAIIRVPIRTPNKAHVAELIDRRAREVSAQIAALERVRADLERLARRARRLSPRDCEKASVCHIIES